LKKSEYIYIFLSLEKKIYRGGRVNSKITDVVVNKDSTKTNVNKKKVILLWKIALSLKLIAIVSPATFKKQDVRIVLRCFFLHKDIRIVREPHPSIY